MIRCVSQSSEFTIICLTEKWINHIIQLLLLVFLDKNKQNNEISECDFERNLDIIKIMVHSNLCVNWN